MLTRNDKDWTEKYPIIAKQLLKLRIDNAILDGEIVSIANDGTMSFHGMQNPLGKGRQERLHYYVFDLLFLNGENLGGLPLSERKNQLKQIFKNSPDWIHYSEHFKVSGEKMLAKLCSMAMEGVVSKRLSKPYYSGRNEYWLKSKCVKEQELVIGGFTTQPMHPSLLAALLMGYFQGNDFIFAGKVGTGFSQSEGMEILKRLRDHERATPAFISISTASKRGAHWVEPRLVAQVHFFEWTPDGFMRHASFQGLREDKPAREVVMEKPKATEKIDPPDAQHKTGKGKRENIAGVSLSHPNKVIFPDAAITKRELALYYKKVAPLMLPYVTGRPISLVRCPDGEGKPCFFQRHGVDMFTPKVKPIYVSDEKDAYLMIEDLGGLISLVQMNALEIHIWNATADDIERPDQFVFDLDPAPDVPFEAVKKAAAEIRNNLKKAKLDSFLKMTGGKGLHVVVPIQKGPSWEEVKDFTRIFAETMVKASPERFTSNIRKNKRTGKIYIDYLRNGKGASAIAPYSTRAKPGAPVAMPLAWRELASLKTAQDYTVERVLKLRRADPWAEMRKIRQMLPH